MATGCGQARYLCSELVTVEWRSVFDRERTEVVNLEEIWASGATLLFSAPIRPATPLRIACHGAEFHGRVVHCRADFIGYLVEVAFDDGSRWSPETYVPEHLFDPRSLVAKDESGGLKEKNDELLAQCVKVISERIA